MQALAISKCHQLPFVTPRQVLNAATIQQGLRSTVSVSKLSAIAIQTTGASGADDQYYTPPV
ncbi:hypothetical protein GCM10007053_26940 [Halioglobus pacificus]|uniref:Uncharacterized protein n=1 Tax=Parahalioglobus pacificus TaxID=930806 RepID=A0A918XLE4_9GAMM|nr:hypothetical protein GCM10007053_26940 [Halioglobus pacificus]